MQPKLYRVPGAALYLILRNYCVWPPLSIRLSAEGTEIRVVPRNQGRLVVSEREKMTIHLWIATVNAFVQGRMEDAIQYEDALSSVENMTDRQYTTSPLVGVR